PVPLSGAEPDSDQAQQEEADACEDFIDRASEEFQSNDDIDAIITAASPTDRDFYDESGETSDQIASEALNDMWQEWEDAGKDVVVIGEVPHFEDVNGPTCVESNPDNIVDACSLPADDVIEGRDSIMKWAAEDSTTPVDCYDPVPGICDTERCYSLVATLITRYDHHHLSASFARCFGTDSVSCMQKKTIVEYPCLGPPLEHREPTRAVLNTRELREARLPLFDNLQFVSSVCVVKNYCGILG